VEKLSGESMNIVNENIVKLKELFPEVFSENKIDFQKLEEELGQFTSTDPERYNFTWAGKSEAKKNAQTPSTGTLRPSKEDSKDWDTTQNLYIEGDNLEVLKLLQKSYHKRVKMIYIDPPYNTGKEFIYPDNYHDNLDTYLEYTNQKGEDGKKFSVNTDTSGRYHTNWLNMMYPRLKLARNLLKDDGVIFISIDDNEVANLRKLCDEIFGEDNFINNVIWQKKYAPQNDAKWFSDNHDHILAYAKNKLIWRPNLLPRSDKQNKYYKYDDNDGRGLWRSDNILVKSFTKDRVFPIINPNTNEEFYPPQGRCWRYNKDTLERMLLENRIYFGKDGTGAPQVKRYLGEVKDGITPLTLWIREEVGDNQDGKNELNAYFDIPTFDTPKPTKLINRMAHIGMNDNDVILDFFSGSATTAHSILKMNAEDNKKRKYIMVQLPEKLDEKNEAYQAGYHTICEIGKERIRRAGDKIKADNSDKDLSSLDIGFKVFKLDSSNIKEWDSDFDNLEESLLDSVENIKTDRTQEDLLYEILLKYGLDLTLPIEEKNIEGKKVFVIGFGALVVCLDDDITTDIVENIAKLKEEYQSEIMRVVFKDSSFSNAVVKTNAIQILKQHDIDEVVSI